MNNGNPIAQLAQDPASFTFGAGGLLGDDLYQFDDFLDLRRSMRSGLGEGPSNLPRIRRPKPKKPWVSPPEFGGVDFEVETVIRYQFQRPQTINYVYFEVANVPCNWTVWALDESQGDFVPLADSLGAPVRGTLLGVRTELTSGRAAQSSLDEFLNPDAVGFGNFLPFEYALPKVSTTVVEFRMDRKVSADLLPRYIYDGSIKVAYSLALRGVRFTHVLETEADLPLDDEEVLFTDPVGGRQRLEKHYQSSHYAADRDIDEDWGSTFWQSGPQPISGAVVPLYLDVRDPETGGAVALDRLSTVPMWPGPHFNVYHSNDDRIGDFFLSNKRSSADLLGGATQERTYGLICNGSDARAEFDAVPMRLDLREDWAVGCVYVPSYDSTDSVTGLRYLWEFQLADGKRLGLAFDPDGDRFALAYDGASVYTSPEVSFVNGDSLAVTVGYNHSEIEPGYWFHTDAVAPAISDEPDEDTRRWTVELAGWGSGDSFSLSWGGETAGPFSHSASGPTTASAIAAALGALTSVGAGNAAVSSTSASLYTVTFDAVVSPYDLAVVGASGCSGTATPVPLEDGEVQDNLVGSAPSISALPSVLAVGNRVGGSSAAGRSAAGGLRQFWVRQDAFALPYARAFSNRPYAFVNGVGPRDRNNGFYRCVFKASFWRDTTARFGPGSGWFDAKHWIPVTRDYVLRNGVHELPPTVAKYLKLEFYNLVVQPYEVRELRMGAPGVDMAFRYWPREVIEYHKRVVPRGRKGSPPKFFRTYPIFSDDNENAWTEARRRRSAKRGGDRQTRDFLAGAGGRFDEERIIYQPGHLPPGMYRSWSRGDRINPRELVDALEFGAVAKQFHLAGPHRYDDEVVTVAGNEAFFVGLKDVSVYRTDVTLYEDTPEYVDLLTDDAYIDPDSSAPTGGPAPAMELIPTGGLLFNTKGAQFQTPTLPSISMVRTVQLAARQSDWDTTLSDGQISLVTTAHLELLAGTAQATVTGAYGGSGAGNLLQLSGAAGPYGIRTKAGLFDATVIGGDSDASFDSTLSYDDSVSYDDTTRFYDLTGARTSAVVRFYLPDAAEGSYELRLYNVLGSEYRLVASTAFSPPAREWGEYEVPYMAKPGETNWVAEVVQTDPTVSEPFVVDMLGIWQNPIRWEVSNDDGLTWTTVLTALNDPDAFVSFPSEDRKLRVRAVALRPGAAVYAWHLVPWYLESPVARRAPIDYAPPWGVSERQDLRAVRHRPMFQAWARMFPQRYSLDQLGTVPTDGQGFTP